MNTPQIYLVRHGQTAWSLSGQHTGRSDIPLLPAGEDDARAVGKYLARKTFSRVFTSPSQRARRTCELAGFGLVAEVDPDLHEWDYGRYEGLTTSQIHQLDPGWTVFAKGAPGGESVADISARADRVVARLRSAGEQALVFSHGHFLRVLAARWVGQPADYCRFLMLGTGSISVLGYERSLQDPAIASWNLSTIGHDKLSPPAEQKPDPADGEQC